MLLARLAKNHHSEYGLAKWLTFALELVSAVVLFALMLLTCADVIGRYLFNNSVNGTTELTELALGVIIFCQIPVVTMASGHVVVDIFDRFLSTLFIKYSMVISNLMVAFGFSLLAQRIAELAARSLRRGVVTEFLGIPVAYFVHFIAIMMYVCAAILVMVSIRCLIRKNNGIEYV